MIKTASRIVKSLIDEKVENFKLAFQKTSFGLFYDEESQGLIHPGEKGTYCESIAKDFLRPFIPQMLDIGTGFIINAYDEVSTQCDIVIYDAKNTPLIENDQKQRFFPVETVVAVGEIKLGKQSIDRTELFDEKDIYDSISTFLICNDITKKDEIEKRISGLYEEKYTRDDYLSFALFVEGGALSHLHEKDGKKEMAPYSNRAHSGFKSKWHLNNYSAKNEHFYDACHYLWMITSLAYIYSPDITSYLTD